MSTTHITSHPRREAVEHPEASHRPHGASADTAPAQGVAPASAPLPPQAREAIVAGHAVLITTSTGRFLLPATLVTTTWQERFAHDPTAVITATGAFGDFFTSARDLPTVTEQTRAQLRAGGCTVHTSDGATLEMAPDTTFHPRAAETPAPVGRED